MKAADKLMGKNVALLVGTKALDLYLKEINWNLRTMIAQTDVLETTILEIEKQVRDPRRRARKESMVKVFVNKRRGVTSPMTGRSMA